MEDHRDRLRRLQDAAADGRLDRLCHKHHVRLLGAHGSAVHGDQPARDLDLAVLFAEGTPRDAIVALAMDLAELTGGGDIDLMDLSHADPVARTHGLSGLPLFEDQPGHFAEAAIAAWSERLDTSWLRRLERQQLLG